MVEQSKQLVGFPSFAKFLIWDSVTVKHWRSLPHVFFFFLLGIVSVHYTLHELHDVGRTNEYSEPCYFRIAQLGLLPSHLRLILRLQWLRSCYSRAKNDEVGVDTPVIAGHGCVWAPWEICSFKQIKWPPSPNAHLEPYIDTNDDLHPSLEGRGRNGCVKAGWRKKHNMQPNPTPEAAVLMAITSERRG